MQGAGDYMYSFKNDYSEGAHPKILETISRNNLIETEGYGLDRYSNQARDLINGTLNKEADIHFFVGGTSVNLIAMTAFLRPHEAAIAVESGHVLTHEAGAIEATGHKVISVNNKTGKLHPEEVQREVDLHTDEHMVKPRMVYISNTTEIGGVYNKAELTALSDVCKKNDLILFMDGARLGSALTSTYNDLTLADIGDLCDAFYIGGTKNGALLGEALVITNTSLGKDMRHIIKQRGALMAKGWLIGIQFATLFTDDLFITLAKHANEQANKIAEVFLSYDYKFLVEPVSNQLFPIIPMDLIKHLEKEFEFYVWEAVDEKQSAVRLVTSWATSQEKVKALIDSINKFHH